jgi:galactokinase
MTARSAIDAGALVERLRATDQAAADDPDAIRIARGPGRVNLIGEHTDYNEGFVLPAAIDLEIRLAFVPTDDRRVEITLAESGERQGFDLDAIPPAAGRWIDYVAGTAWSLQDAGLRLHGLRGVLGSTLPRSSGLSSSAALELTSAWALLDPPDLAAHGIDTMRLALLCQRAENVHIGVLCGIMDQFASASGEAGRALLLDCRSLEHRAVALPSDEHVLVVCDTNVPRRLEASEYNVRRAQCEAAAAAIGAQEPSVRSLRDVDPVMLARHADRLEPALRRRARHIVHENDRVLRTVAALEAGDVATVGAMFAASHASLRDDFEVSSPELDAMVEIAAGTPGVVAARMTGAGFGGCTVNLVRRDAVDAVRAAVERDYPARTGRTPRVHVVEAAAGAGLLWGARHD